MHSRLYWLIVVLILGSIVMGACAPRIPAGTYEPDQKLMIDWIRFDADGTWTAWVLPAEEVKGRYTVDGDKVTLLTDAGICQPFQSIYHWKIQGNVLTFAVIDEGCKASTRQADLTGRSWIKQP